MSLIPPPAQPLEGNFTTYAKVIDQLITGSVNSNIAIVGINNDGTVLAWLSTTQMITIDINGNQVTVDTSPGYGNNTPITSKVTSSTAKYQVLYDFTSNTLIVVKGAVVLTSITVDFATKFLNSGSMLLSISANGKYITMIGTDHANVNQRVQIWRGS